MSTVTVSVQKIDMTAVRKIIVTDILEDTDGTFLRAVRFYGDPIPGSQGPSLLLETLSRSAFRPDLVVDTPVLGF